MSLLGHRRARSALPCSSNHCASALWELDEAVGGVGGVGGLTNQYGPTPTCNTTEDLIGTNDTAPYCFHPGFSGFTPFGALTILLATVPLAVSALATHFAERHKGSAHGERARPAA